MCMSGPTTQSSGTYGGQGWTPGLWTCQASVGHPCHCALELWIPGRAVMPLPLPPQDLSSPSQYDTGVALTGLSCFVTPDLARDLANDIMTLVSKVGGAASGIPRERLRSQALI